MTLTSAPLLPITFYERDALEVARALLGMYVCRDEVVVRITEVEAYRWPEDSASHGRFGRTARNAPMWGPAGRAYVFTCYGLHHLLNVVTGHPDEAAAVLLRAAEPVAGIAAIRARRGGRHGPVLLSGPGKLGAALGLDRGWNHHELHRAGGLELRRGVAFEDVLHGPRVGVGYADPAHRDAPWRLAAAGTPWVSRRAGLAACTS